MVTSSAAATCRSSVNVQPVCPHAQGVMLQQYAELAPCKCDAAVMNVCINVDSCVQELEGRPRVDVLCNMSGIFRDSFQNVVELLDDLFKRAAQAPEPSHQNFIRYSRQLHTRHAGLPCAIACKARHNQVSAMP